MDDIRKAASLVRQEFDDPCALAHRRFVTAGVALFVRMADEYDLTVDVVEDVLRRAS